MLQVSATFQSTRTTRDRLRPRLRPGRAECQQARHRGAAAFRHAQVMSRRRCTKAHPARRAADDQGRRDRDPRPAFSYARSATAPMPSIACSNCCMAKRAGAADATPPDQADLRFETTPPGRQAPQRRQGTARWRGFTIELVETAAASLKHDGSGFESEPKL